MDHQWISEILEIQYDYAIIAALNLIQKRIVIKLPFEQNVPFKYTRFAYGLAKNVGFSYSK